MLEGVTWVKRGMRESMRGCNGATGDVRRYVRGYVRG